MIHYFDRSRIETSFKCPRREYWEYYYDGKGLQPAKMNQHLAFGGAVHELIGSILHYYRESDNAAPDMTSIVQYLGLAIEGATTGLRKVFATSKGFQSETLTEIGFDGEMVQVTENQDWLIDHYCDLLEALVTGWCLVRLPVLMEQYRVLQVETEERLQLSDELVLLSRPDAILERRTDGALVILSLKTVSQVNPMWLDNFKTDQQTISEVLPVEARLGREVTGVQVEGLVKGQARTEWPKGSGHWHHSSPLVWGYMIEAGGLDLEWKSQFEWKDEAGNNRRLGKGWNRQRISERYPGGIAAWVQWLYENDPELLRAQFPSPPLISRSEHELQEWQQTVTYRETQVHNALVQIEQAANALARVHAFDTAVYGSTTVPFPEMDDILARVFPKHTTGCAYDPQFHSKCPMYNCCWGPQGADPIGSGEFVYRTPNHPEAE